MQPPVTNTLPLKKIALGFLLLTGLIMAFYFLSKPLTDRYTVYRTPFKSDQEFSHLEGDAIYSYNGLVFYKTAIDSGGFTTLYDSGRLPVPDKVYWAGDRGALMTFSGSFSRSAISRAANPDSNLVPMDAHDDTWFVDFDKKTVSRADTVSPIEGAAYFSRKENGFYYLTAHDDWEATATGNAAIKFFDVAKHESRTLGTLNSSIDISHVGACPEGSGSVCIVSRRINAPQTRDITALKADGSTVSLYKLDGQVTATNNPNLYLISRHDYGGEEETGGDAPIDLNPAEMELLDVRDKSTRQLGYETTSSPYAAYFYDGDKFYVLHDRTTDSSGYLAGGKSLFNSIGVQQADIRLNGEHFSQDLTPNTSYGNGGISLVSDSARNMYLITPDGADVQLPEKGNLPKREVEQCAADYSADVQYLDSVRTFRVLVPDDAAFHDRIADFSTCITSDAPQMLIGYRFQFAGVSPSNGRITTD